VIPELKVSQQLLSDNDANKTVLGTKQKMTKNNVLPAVAGVR